MNDTLLNFVGKSTNTYADFFAVQQKKRGFSKCVSG